jgi:hypothetical protein
VSETASYAYLSVLRRGLAAMIAPGAAETDPRVGVPVSLSIGGSPAGAPALALRGPGDVAGFDGAIVRRTWPVAGADNAEPNYFALIELLDPDLPWRFTPAPSDGDRLAPWLCLIVLEEGELGGQVAGGPGRPLAVVTVNDAGALPDLSQSWAWAHAQILGAPESPATDFDAAAVAALLAQAPSRLSSRLLCPRQLHPQTSYHAFLVPTFERGRLAGLGQSTAGVDRLAPAWKPGQEPVTLPIYFAWGFQTGEPGDFASLVAKLQPVGDLPESVWRRELAVSPPGKTPPAWQAVDLESALIPPETTLDPWPGMDEHGFTTALASRTNAGGKKLEPPLYGRWLAAADSLVTTADARPPWFHELNGDPRARVAAGLGTVVVQSEQQQLLAGAWAQVQGIREANRALRLAQLARELALSVYNRHLAPLDAPSLLEVSASLHTRVLAGQSTVGAQIDASAIANGSLAPTWRRKVRPLGSLGVRQRRPLAPAQPPEQSALARMNDGSLSIAPAPAAAAEPPAGNVQWAGARLGDLAVAFARADVTPEKLHTLPRPDGFVVRDLHSISPAVLHAAATTVSASTAATHAGTAATHAGTGATHGLPATTAQPATLANGFLKAASALMTQLAQPPAPGVTWLEADLKTADSAIRSRLDPVATIQEPLVERLTGVVPGPRRTDPLEPVMAAPEFPQPMYQPLTGMGREWLLPGLDTMPADSVALFMTNWRFVESYLVGLNHELARKLLWNGYPTDQRGTYFRHFWDMTGHVDGSIDADIGPIHGWTAPLGENRPSSIDPLVLLVRGALIRRYPNVVVYAAQAETDADGRHPGATEKHPIFYGRVEPDVALFGFDLDPEVARGNPGWFFVLQEHPSEPRFGLAAPNGGFGGQPASWDKLGWDHLVTTAEELAALRYVDLGAALPLEPASPDEVGAVWHSGGTPPSRSADLAHITLRRPKRFAVHGSILIPATSPPPPADA